jgi:O-methyltransferase
MTERITIAGPAWPVTYNADGLATVHNADFTLDPLFRRACALGMATPHHYGDIHFEWRIYTCCWAALQAKHLGADYVECGVNTGVYSRAVMEYIDFAQMSQTRFYLLDTYDGIPVEQLTDDELARGIAGHNDFYYDCYAEVIKTFAPFQNARIIRGCVPETLSQIDSDEIGYASIDMNSAVPEIAAGEFLWPRLVPGAIVVLDDYGWRTHFGQKQAWDEFAARRNLKILSLPTGQGLLVKPPRG